MSENVRKMFADIAHRYDLLNDVLSFGIHKKWRRKTVLMCNINENSAVLDCACGTGDLSFEFAKSSRNVIGTDFCQEMLDVAIEKSKKFKSNVKFQQADAMNLPFESEQFDVVSIAFGIRNVDNVEKAISEMARVLKSGGKLAVLEFGQPTGFIKIFYNLYSKSIMPKIGKLLAKSESAYTYLPETASKFPCAENFLAICDRTYNFKKSQYVKLSFGIAYLYILEK